MLGSIIGDIIGSTYELRPVKRTDFPLFPQGSRLPGATPCVTSGITPAIPRRASANCFAAGRRSPG